MRFRRALLPALLAAGLLAFAFAPTVLADNFGLSTAGSAAGLNTASPDLAKSVGNLLKPILGFVGVLFLLLMVYAGFLYMTARGDSKRVDTAKQLIVSAIIGVAIIASAYAITSFVIGSVTGGAATSAPPTPSTPSTPSGPSCTASCTKPLDCGGLPDSCGICSSCRCADGSLSTNGTPCVSTGSCVCN